MSLVVLVVAVVLLGTGRVLTRLGAAVGFCVWCSPSQAYGCVVNDIEDRKLTI